MAKRQQKTEMGFWHWLFWGEDLAFNDSVGRCCTVLASSWLLWGADLKAEECCTSLLVSLMSQLIGHHAGCYFHVSLQQPSWQLPLNTHFQGTWTILGMGGHSHSCCCSCPSWWCEDHSGSQLRQADAIWIVTQAALSVGRAQCEEGKCWSGGSPARTLNQYETNACHIFSPLLLFSYNFFFLFLS